MITTLDSREHILAISWVCLVESCGIRPWSERGPRKLVDTQGPLAPSSRAVHLNKLEARQTHQKACMDEEGTHSKTQT